MSPKAKELKERELARLKYLVDDGYSHFEQKLEEAQQYSDENWEAMVDSMTS